MKFERRKVNEAMNCAGNVLYVEKNRSAGRLLSRLLEESGFEVFVSYEPMRALDLCGTHEFGVALVEYKLPQMTGPQLAGRIKELRPEAPVVMISGRSWLPASELLHVDAHFGNYTSFDDLLERMRTLCNRDRGAARPTGKCLWGDST